MAEADPWEPKVMGKMRHCFNCGQAIGVYVEWDRLDTCGQMECEREARAERAEQRAEAHDRLDRDLDWRM